MSLLTTILKDAAGHLRTLISRFNGEWAPFDTTGAELSQAALHQAIEISTHGLFEAALAASLTTAFTQAPTAIGKAASLIPFRSVYLAIALLVMCAALAG